MPKKRVTKKKSATTRNRAGTTAPASAGKTAGKAKQAKSSGGAAGKAKAKARRPANRAARQADAPLAQLEHLISMMVEKEVVEVEFEQAGTRWRVRRAEPHVTYTQAAPMPMAMPQGAAMPGIPMPMAAAVDTAE
ncbi:MAG: hypothetical protein KDC98_09095, partial [Planctomycetes bacterium]|nr:hypothetical protein [Planctomycetota bacterium]